MAVTTITPVAPSRDSSATLAKTAITTDTMAVFQCPKAGKFAILVEATGTLPATVELLPGTGVSAGMGTKTLTFARSSSWFVGPLSTARFKSGSMININLGPTLTGNLAVVKLP